MKVLLISMLMISLGTYAQDEYADEYYNHQTEAAEEAPDLDNLPAEEIYKDEYSNQGTDEFGHPDLNQQEINRSPAVEATPDERDPYAEETPYPEDSYDTNNEDYYHDESSY